MLFDPQPLPLSPSTQRNGYPPITEAVRNGHGDILAMLMADDRVDVGALSKTVRRGATTSRRYSWLAG